MSRTAEPTDSITQLGEVLAEADRHIQEIVAAAEQRAHDRLRHVQAQLDARTAELNAIADDLLAASAAIHHQIERLRSLTPIEGVAVDEPAPAPVAPQPAPAAPRPAPAAAPRAVPDPTASPFAGAQAPVDGDTAVASLPVPGPTHDHDHHLPIIGGSEDEANAAAQRLDSARLVALSMAASGRSRREVEAHLRDKLGIADYGSLIDYVFGISTPASVVPSWPPRRRRRSD